VLPREFSSKNLWVPQRFVTPPEGARERIEAEGKLLNMIFSVFTEQWMGEGSFILPLEGKRAHNFGQKRVFNNLHHSVHSGEDIQAEFGTPVRASNSGRIALVADLYYAGKIVILDHGLGVFSLYCHLSHINVKGGSFAKKGDVLGMVGSTGRVTGPHLHWGFKVHGQRVDPNSVLSLSLEKPE
jgi:murein DD-endopeptidase MepM/ murein hydrolase activator NlpD